MDWIFRAVGGSSFLFVQQPFVGQDLLNIEVSRSHSGAPHSVGLIWKNDRPDFYVITHNTHSRKSRAASGFRTRNPGKRKATDSRLRPSGHWNRQVEVECPAKCNEVSTRVNGVTSQETSTLLPGKVHEVLRIRSFHGDNTP
jgi:hypothetical protein